MFRRYCNLSLILWRLSLTDAKAREMVARGSGIEQTRALAQQYADKAIEAVSIFPDSEAKSGLVEMCNKSLKRRK